MKAENHGFQSSTNGFSTFGVVGNVIIACIGALVATGVYSSIYATGDWAELAVVSIVGAFLFLFAANIIHVVSEGPL